MLPCSTNIKVGGSIPSIRAKQNKMKSETRGRKKKPKGELIKGFTIWGKVNRIEELGGIEKVRELVESKLKLRV